MDIKKFEDLMTELDGLDRHQIKKVIVECVKLLIEMLPNKKKGGF